MIIPLPGPEGGLPGPDRGESWSIGWGGLPGGVTFFLVIPPFVSFRFLGDNEGMSGSILSLCGLHDGRF